jgi:hypothetical protein
MVDGSVHTRYVDMDVNASFRLSFEMIGGGNEGPGAVESCQHLPTGGVHQYQYGGKKIMLYIMRALSRGCSVFLS